MWNFRITHLTSPVESSTAEAIAELTVTSAKYEEAIATLKKRFGNPQLIVDRHMASLLRMSTVRVSQNNIMSSKNVVVSAIGQIYQQAILATISEEQSPSQC